MAENIKASEISRVLLKELEDINIAAQLEEVGQVLQISDGVARVYGLAAVQAGELLKFECGVMGVAMNLEIDNVGAVSYTHLTLPTKA